MPDTAQLWRTALLGTVAAGALLFGYGRTARAGPGTCVVSGNTAICQGDQSDGITNQGGTPDFSSPPVEILNVNNLTADITPAFGAHGIAFQKTGDITINSNTGPFSIVADGGAGIYAFSSGTGNVKVTSVGNVTARETAILALAQDGAVTINSTGDLTSTNDLGIEALSYGTGDVKVTSVGNVTAQLTAIFALAADGSVTVNSTGDLTSVNCCGINAISLGGGDVKVTSVGDVTTQQAAILAIAQDGSVTVSSTGDLTSSGSYGVYAISFSAGPVKVTSVGNVTARDIGIFAVSGTGAVTIDSTGDITSTTSDAIFVYGGSRGTVTLRNGRVHGADAGVGFEDGVTNTLRNFAKLSGGNLAVRGGTGNETVLNHGLITGNVDLGGGANAVLNEAGGTFRSGTTVTLGAGNTLTNRGILAPGLTPGAIQTTALTGNLVQTGSGAFAVDLDLAGSTSDHLDATGTASLAGTVVVGVTTLPGALTQQFTILSAAGGAANKGLGVFASPALNATLTYPNPNDAVLGITVDFSAKGLNTGQTAIGDHLNGALAAGSDLAGALLGLLNTLGLKAYKDALDQLSPEVYSTSSIAALYASLGFSNALLSCKTNGTDVAAVVREGQCLWAGAQARFTDRERTRENIGFDKTEGLFSAGAQVALDPAWRLGFGISYQNSALDTDTGVQSRGDLVLGGVAVKYNAGPLLLAATASGGRGWYDTTRPMSFGGFSALAESDQEIDTLAGGLHASYVIGSTALYAKPLADVNAMRVDFGDVQETGAGGAGLVVRGGEETVVTVAPALEIGTQWHWANGTLVRPYIRGGATWFSDDEVALEASFLGSPAGVAPFRIVNEFDAVRADFGVGLDLINGEDAAMRLNYDGHFGEITESHSFSIKGSTRF